MLGGSISRQSRGLQIALSEGRNTFGSALKSEAPWRFSARFDSPVTQAAVTRSSATAYAAQEPDPTALATEREWSVAASPAA